MSVASVLERRRRLIGLAEHLGAWSALLADRAQALAHQPLAGVLPHLAWHRQVASSLGRETSAYLARPDSPASSSSDELLVSLLAIEEEARALWQQAAPSPGGQALGEHLGRCRCVASQAAASAERARVEAEMMGDAAAAMIFSDGCAHYTPADESRLVDALLRPCDGQAAPGWLEDAR